MKILITGGSGFIGSNFTRYFLANYDNSVINIDKMGTGSNPANLADVEKRDRYTFVNGDTSNANIVKKLVQDMDVIINFAAETHVDRSIANPNPFFESNTKGTFILLEAIRNSKQSTKFIQVSTDEVYGDITKGSFKEHNALRPSNPYSASKAAAEMFCLAYHRTYGLDVIITRCTNNFGPYQHPEKLIPKAIIRAQLNLPVPVYGEGTNIRDWIYVLDHCEAINFLLKKGEAGEIYNISSGNELTNIDLIRKILEIMRKKEDLITYVEDRPGHDIRYSLDSSKISSLGWAPKNSLAKALNETVKWYLKNESWWRPLADEKTLHQTPWKLE